MPIYFNWSRRRKCPVCGEWFTTMAPNADKCAVCRHTEEAKRERHERHLKACKAFNARAKARKRRIPA